MNPPIPIDPVLMNPSSSPIMASSQASSLASSPVLSAQVARTRVNHGGGGGAASLVLSMNQQKATIERQEAKINQLTREGESLRIEIEELREVVMSLKELVDNQAADIIYLQEDVDNLTMQIEESKHRERLSTVDGNASEGALGESDDESVGQEGRQKMEASLEAYHDVNLKSLTRFAYCFQLGVPKLNPVSNLPWYESDDRSTWPRINGLEDPVVRFKWDQPWNEAENFASIQRITNYMTLHGGRLIPAAVDALAAISLEDLQNRVVQKFVDIQREMRKECILGPRNKRITQRDDEDDGVVVVADGARMKSEKKRATLLASRAKGKLDVRLRKRDNLPKDSKYREKKFDAAFIVNAMSEDEDELGEDGNPTGNFISRAPTYRSQILKELYETIDAQKDPKASARYTRRIRGAPQEVPPKISTKFAYRIRRWMVDAAWLEREENKQYDTETRIVDSGKAWGDDEDPEDIAERQARIKGEKKFAQEERKRKAGGEIKKSKKKTKKGAIPAMVDEAQDRGSPDDADDLYG